MGDKDEPKFINSQKNKKDPKIPEETSRQLDNCNFFQGNLQIKFNEFDPQKGGLSPRFLFKKRTHLFFSKRPKPVKTY